MKTQNYIDPINIISSNILNLTNQCRVPYLTYLFFLSSNIKELLHWIHVVSAT